MTDATDLVVDRLGDRVQRDVPLGPRCTYRVGGPARLLVEVADADELVAIGDAVAGTDIDVLVLGLGSNLLVADAGFDGLAIVLDRAGFDHIVVEGTTVVAGAAARLPLVARRSVAAGLTGFEWAVGVPGSIGGAVRMNAGGHGADMAASLRSIQLLDLRTGFHGTVAAPSLDLGYRTSSVAPYQVVIEATLGLADADDPAVGTALIDEIVAWRREHQPGGQNAGSVFTNPPGDSAGRLIEGAGLKGHRVGTAAVSDKHANFIQADPDGRADHVRALMVEVARAVERHAGVRLHPETRMVGFARPWAEEVGW